ncbi:MAG: phosphate acyltransferase PlsX [candidate division WOR-3 bacterium]|nr:phosphate acyltransferase PlsX [candidate division WOR-3 bacterium]
MRIALDTMGSDNAPLPELAGAKSALDELVDLEITLVGKKEILCQHQLPDDNNRWDIIDAEQVVGMNESPSSALKLKNNSSIAQAIKLHKENKVYAVVSAGNTGAIMAFAMTILGMIAGIDRPALAAIFPSLQGSSLIIDIGANINVKPINLYQFGVMGTIVAGYLFAKANPTVGLLNIGKEETKGTETLLSAYKILSQSELNFIGNIEGQDIFKGKCDVIVCDGFVGNILLKFGEGFVESIKNVLDELGAEYKLRKWLSKPMMGKFLNRLDYEEHGGALLLGINGTVVIAHGRSTEKALKNAIKTAYEAVQNKISEHIAKKFKS